MTSTMSGDSAGHRGGQGIICAVYHCRNYRLQKGKNRSFFRFPVKDEERCLKWLAASERPDLDELVRVHGISKLYERRICEDHFHENDFRNPEMKSQGLKRDAVPLTKLRNDDGDCFSRRREKIEENDEISFETVVYDDTTADEEISCTSVTTISHDENDGNLGIDSSNHLNVRGMTCAMYNCSNYRFQKGKSKSFFRFPVKDRERCLKWLAASKRLDLDEVVRIHGLSKIYERRICEDHFHENDFRNPEMKSQGLKNNAVPFTKLRSNEGKCFSRRREKIEENSVDDEISFVTVVTEDITACESPPDEEISFNIPISEDPIVSKTVNFDTSVTTISLDENDGNLDIDSSNHLNGRGTSCAIYNCRNYRFQKGRSRSFFRFPVKDRERCTKWLTASKRPDLDEVVRTHGLSKLYERRICEDHFHENDFRNPEMKSQGLKRNAFPSKNLPKISGDEISVETSVSEDDITDTEILVPDTILRLL